MLKPALLCDSKISSASKSPCTLLFILTLTIFTIYTALHHHRHRLSSVSENLKDRDALYYQNTFLSMASNYTVAKYLRHLTLHPHLAGTPPSLQTALYVKKHFESLGFETHTSNYTALLSYHLKSSLTAHFGNGSSVHLPLSEPGVPQNGVPSPYHAYSPTGSAYGMAVFLNYGTDQDYIVLGTHGVYVKGCIGIVRRGAGLSRNAVVDKAAAHGVAAVLMYTDGDIDGDKYRAGVERGTVMNGLGDPLSPGWPGLEGGESLEFDDPQVTQRFPTIPSMPVSAETAETVLKSLEGTRLPQEWRENLKVTKIGRIGPGPIMLNFTYQGERKKAAIHNIFAVIKGLEEPDRIIILGNHRDAWTYGAVDPNSGTSALLDIARRYALLMRLGWTPRRTVMFCSWDAEEFGMIGSTEWVEDNLENLGSKTVAYLNMDCAVQGPGFFAGSTPQLDDLLIEITKQVKGPDTENTTVYESWKASERGVSIHRLSGVDSDFAPFLQHAGVPSVDLYYGRDFPVYHTAYDSYEWMMNSGDPMFQRHVTVSGIWGLVALHLADDPILPFNYLSYALELQDYTSALSNVLKEENISLHPVSLAIEKLEAAAKDIQEEMKNLRDHEAAVVEHFVLKKRMLNDRLMLAERGFLDADGLRGGGGGGRRWFRHLIYGPRSSSGAQSKLDFFPGVVDAIYSSPSPSPSPSRSPLPLPWRKDEDGRRQREIQHEIWRVARAIERAARVLNGNLT